MKIQINNLTALIQGRDLNLYQRSLAVEEWHKLLNHVEEMEQALSIANVVQRTWLFCGGHGKKYFEIEVNAEDMETAIAYFETDYPELKWVMTKEL